MPAPSPVPSIESLLQQARAQSGALAVAWTGGLGRVDVPRLGGAPWDAGLGWSRGWGPCLEPAETESSAADAFEPAGDGADHGGPRVGTPQRVLRLGPQATARIPRLATLGARFAAVRYEPARAGSEPRRLAFAARSGLSLSDEAIEALFTALVALEEERRQAELARRRSTLANLGRSAAGAAHDLRNELSTALFELDALDAGIQGAEAGLRDSVLSARDLARDFLELEEAPVRRPVDLRKVLRRELARLPGHAIESQAELTSGGPLWVAGRRDLIARIAANLLSNAVQASRRDRTVRVEVRQAGARVELSVTDRGRGMDQARLERYLEPGSSRAGTGFGTASVRHCLTRVGGELWIESVAGSGTRCVAELLAAPGPDRPAALIHDPDPVARWSWREVFERAGWLPLEAKDPDEALAWLEAGALTTVLTPRSAKGSARIARALRGARHSKGGPTLVTTGAGQCGEQPRVADRNSTVRTQPATDHH